MDTSKQRRLGKIILWLAVGVAVGLAVWKYLLPCLLPFLFAFLTAALCEPVVRFMTERLRVRRGIASAVCVLVVLLSLVGFFLLVVVRLADEAVELVLELPQLAAGLPQVLTRLERAAARFIESAPAGVQSYLEGALRALNDRAMEIPASLSATVLEKLSGMVAAAPGAALACATYVIGSFFISAGFRSVCAFLSRQVPERFQKTAQNLKTDLFDGLGKWLRAELTLLGITFLELTAAFMLLGVQYGAVIALGTAVIDALPVFGTGAVLLPWAAVSLIGGDAGRAVGLVVTYLIATLVRSCLEPKLIGDQFGVAPAAALLAMYTGFKLAGVAGMVLFPFLLMMLNQMNRKGYIKLWK